MAYIAAGNVGPDELVKGCVYDGTGQDRRATEMKESPLCVGSGIQELIKQLKLGT